jgi:predicted heme/steroid binding protein
MDDLLRQIDTLLGEVYYMLDLLSNQLSEESRRALLIRIRSHISHLWDLINLLVQTGTAQPVFAIRPETQEPVITQEELMMNNGKNGNPAYVAVNGVVYNMSDVPSWAAANHFGLAAGQDLTEEFLACHANQAIILSRLQEVGRLEDGSTRE